MTPTDPVTTDDLVVGIITESTDPDGDEVTTGYVWTVDGVISDETSETVPASATTKGEVWTVNVISNDGTLDSTVTFSDHQEHRTCHRQLYRHRRRRL